MAVTFLLRHTQKSKLQDIFGRESDLHVMYVFRAFPFSPYLFAAMIDLLLGFLLVQRILIKHHQYK